MDEINKIDILNIWNNNFNIERMKEEAKKEDDDKPDPGKMHVLTEDDEKNFVEKNKVAVMDEKTVLKTINRTNVEIVSQNLPYLSMETNFSRNELHNFYIMFKALSHATS